MAAKGRARWQVCWEGGRLPWDPGFEADEGAPGLLSQTFALFSCTSVSSLSSLVLEAECGRGSRW